MIDSIMIACHDSRETFFQNHRDAEIMSTHASPIIEISSGKILGKLEDSVIKFLGIPYAEAPVGRKRFSAPRLHPKWDNIRSCVKYGPACVQGDPSPINLPHKQSDDCLYLNVWTRALEQKKPIMV